MSVHPILPSGYGDWLKSLKSRIASARQRAALAVNQELVTLYHSTGKDILQRQANEGWGAKVIQRLSTDLGEAFPDMKGFSTRNLKYMKFFAEFCPDLQIGQQPAAQLPWFHIISLLTKIPDPAAREWYAIHAVSEGWSRPTLDSHIKSRLHLRQGGVISFPTSASLRDLCAFAVNSSDSKPPRRRIRALRHRQSHRHRRILTRPRPPRAARHLPARHRAN